MKISLSRRGFLQTAGAGTVTMWIPNHASGYTAAEMREKAAAGSTGRRLEVGARHAGAVRRSRQDGSEPGDDAAEARRQAPGSPAGRTRRRTSARRSRSCSWRPGAIGICTAKVSEAEALFANGIEKILMTTCERVGEQDSPRDEDSQGATATFIQAVDNPQNAQDLSDAAKEAGIVADVVIDVAVGTRSRHAGRRTGARAGAAGRQAAEPEAARDDQLRRQRPAHQGIHEARRGDAQAIRAVAARPSRR